MDAPDMSGLGPLIVLGLIAAVLLIALVPPSVVWFVVVWFIPAWKTWITWWWFDGVWVCLIGGGIIAGWAWERRRQRQLKAEHEERLTLRDFLGDSDLKWVFCSIQELRRRAAVKLMGQWPYCKRPDAKPPCNCTTRCEGVPR